MLLPEQLSGSGNQQSLCDLWLQHLPDPQTSVLPQSVSWAEGTALSLRFKRI